MDSSWTLLLKHAKLVTLDVLLALELEPVLNALQDSSLMLENALLALLDVTLVNLPQNVLNVNLHSS